MDKSPYIITDDLLIHANARLAIAPGVEILMEKPITLNPKIPQLDHTDSFAVSIYVQGQLKCIGRKENRIRFSSRQTNKKQCYWYGIILDTEGNSSVEISYTDFAEACNALTIKQGSPLIRNCIFEFNNVSMVIKNRSKPRIYNCIIAYNFTSGIFIREANPSLLNNIIVFNQGHGIWSDQISFMGLEYNCLFGNAEGNLYGCDPKLGLLTRTNKNKDSIDFAHNLFQDPIFSGSSADSLAAELDTSLTTDKSRVKDTTIAKLTNPSLKDSIALKWISREYKRFSLSPYSPCIDAGKSGKVFADMNGSRNDMGIFGGQEFIDFSQ